MFPLGAKSGHSASQQNRALRGLSFDRRVGAEPEALKGSLDFRYPHLGFNRAGNETILMGGVMASYRALPHWAFGRRPT
jgi:hypothetical protein